MTHMSIGLVDLLLSHGRSLTRDQRERHPAARVRAPKLVATARAKSVFSDSP